MVECTGGGGCERHGLAPPGRVDRLRERFLLRSVERVEAGDGGAAERSVQRIFGCAHPVRRPSGPNATAGSIERAQTENPLTASTLSTRFAESLARAYDRTPPGLRAWALRGPQRRVVIGRVFATMERSLDRERAQGVESVIHWEIAREGSGADRWQVAIGDGRCVAGRRLDREPAVTIKLGGEAFLDLVSGRTAAPALYMSGRLRVEGDPMQAARLTSLFRVPTPRPRP